MGGQKTRTTYGQKNGQTGTNYRPQSQTDRQVNKSPDVSKTRLQGQVKHTETTYTTYNMNPAEALNPAMHKAPSTYLVRHAKLLDHRCCNGSRLVEV